MSSKLTNKEVHNKIEQIRGIEAKLKSLKEEIAALQSELKEELDIRQVDSIDLGDHRVHYYASESKRIDNSLLKKDGLYEKYLKSSLSVTFKITDIKGGICNC